MLRVTDLHLRYRTRDGAVDAVRGVSFAVEHGKFFTLLGPSGCGKTSTLRSIAGLETPAAGTIEIGNTVVFSASTRTCVPVYRRNIGMVFQSYAIWPHMTVYDNVAYPLAHGGKLPRNVVREKAMWALGLVQLDAYAERPAPTLSGGQQQRVALARALVREPEVLLLDEPLSNLDAKLRESMRVEIKSLVKRLQITTLFVTHDQLEALSMSDEVALMRNGEIVQTGVPRSVYLEPQDAFVANFLGKTNLLSGEVAERSTFGGVGRVRTAWGILSCAIPDDLPVGASVTVGFRPEGIEVADQPPPSADNVLSGRVASATFSGDAIEYRVDLGDVFVHAKSDPLAAYPEGATVFLRVSPQRCYILRSAADRHPPDDSAAAASGSRPAPAEALA